MNKSIKEINLQLNMGLDVYRYYIDPNIPIKRKILSPLRKEKHPSFAIYPHSNTGIVFFTDHGSGKYGNHWTFVQELFKLDFKDAVDKVKHDILGEITGIRWGDLHPVQEEYQEKMYKKSQVELHPIFRDWHEIDYAFWSRFKISQAILEFYNVKPISRYTMIKDDKQVKIVAQPDSPMYCITFPSGKVKIYQPFAANKRFKWISNTDGDVDVFGLEQIPSNCDRLFILAGNKDVMSFRSVIGEPAIALNSESKLLDENLLFLLSQISENIYVLYDNDETGIENAQKLQEQYGFPSLNYLLDPWAESGVGDFSDLVDKFPNDIPLFQKNLFDNINE